MSVHSSIINVKIIVVALLIVSFFLVPPSMLGLKYTFVALPLLIFALLLFLTTCGFKNASISTKSISLLLVIWCYYLYLCVQSVLLVGFFKIDYLKSIVSITVFLIVFGIIFSDFKIRYLFFRTLIAILLLFVVSNLFTIALSFIFGAENLIYFEVAMYGDTYKLQILFPFTVTYGRMLFFDDIIMRLSSLFREPGIAQAFYIWGFVISHRYFQSKVVKPLLILGCIMTLSTTGFLLLAAVIFFNTVIENNNLKKTILSSLLLLAAFGIYTVVPGVSLESKNAESYDARVIKLEQTQNLLMENPLFGVGASDPLIEGTSTSFLQQGYAIGGMGIFLFILIFITGFIFELRDWKVYLISIFPLLATALIAQPIYDTAILYLLIFASHTYPENKYCV